ncbi:MAG: hypothetical protein IPM53_29295 [Anaerolineaceae bacterium]|nr:hypothetical protein [Anaerolineaceae bacterium]
MNPTPFQNGGFKVAKQNSINRQLSAQDVYQLVSDTRQEHFQLDIKNRDYTAQDIWDVLVAASVERISIKVASKLLEATPSCTMVRTLIKTMLQDVDQMADVERRVNELLTVRLPHQLLKSKLPAAIDLTELPYYG